jgi:Family of unknown function (DUF5993)
MLTPAGVAWQGHTGGRTAGGSELSLQEAGCGRALESQRAPRARARKSKGDRAMMAVPFMAFALSMGLAWRGREGLAQLAVAVALAASACVFFYHVGDPLKVAL